MSGYMMCPICREFIELGDNMLDVVCPHCGNTYRIHDEAGKDNKQEFNDYRTNILATHKLHAIRRRIFMTGCRIMNRGLYHHALELFEMIPSVKEAKQKAQECREALTRKKHQ